jgi:hypothetical protein
MGRLLAGIPLQPKHRVVIMRMAINKNLAVNNYGTAAKILEVCTERERERGEGRQIET